MHVEVANAMNVG